MAAVIIQSSEMKLVEHVEILCRIEDRKLLDRVFQDGDREGVGDRCIRINGYTIFRFHVCDEIIPQMDQHVKRKALERHSNLAEVEVHRRVMLNPIEYLRGSDYLEDRRQRVRVLQCGAQNDAEDVGDARALFEVVADGVGAGIFGPFRYVEAETYLAIRGKQLRKGWVFADAGGYNVVVQDAQVGRPRRAHP